MSPERPTKISQIATALKAISQVKSIGRRPNLEGDPEPVDTCTVKTLLSFALEFDYTVSTALTGLCNGNNGLLTLVQPVRLHFQGETEHQG